MLVLAAFGVYSIAGAWYSNIPERVLFAVDVVPFSGLFVMLAAALLLCTQFLLIVFARLQHQLSWVLIILCLVLPWILGIFFFEFLWFSR